MTITNLRNRPRVKVFISKHPMLQDKIASIQSNGTMTQQQKEQLIEEVILFSMGIGFFGVALILLGLG